MSGVEEGYSLLLEEVTVQGLNNGNLPKLQDLEGHCAENAS
jgi:hypothetical protein